ncbi:MAG: hypothetical protein P8Z31_07755 [Gammaproteobacteria bacterium]|jgi:hypothetical protein
MNPELIVFGIRSVVRLWTVSNAALEERARNAEILFPWIETPEVDIRTKLTGFFNRQENRGYVFGAEAPYAEYWDNTKVRSDPTSVDAMLIAAARIKAEQGGKFSSDTEREVSVTLVKQWSHKDRPASPLSQIVLTAADIVLEYVSTNPSLLGLKGNGEKLLAAYATNLGQVLPDDGKLGPRERFGERLLGVFLRAGLSTVNEHPEWVVTEDHVAELIHASTDPLLAKWESDPTKQLKWQDISETMMGPAASAAMQTLAKHQTEFLGGRLDPGRALGAVTRALFVKAAEQRLSDIPGKERLLGLYGAILDVAAKHPRLFLGDDQTDRDALNHKLFTEVLEALEGLEAPFDREVGSALAGVALEAAAARATLLGQTGDEWHKAGQEILGLVTSNLGAGLKGNEKLSDVLSGETLTQLGRILLSRLADAATIIPGHDNLALEAILKTVSAAMISDEHLLLMADDWLEIVTVAVEEAMANPERLFKLAPHNPAGVLAGQLIGMVLHAASDAARDPNTGSCSVLYGKTLRDVIIEILRAGSGNPDSIRTHIAKIEDVVRKLNELVGDNSQNFGSKEWLRLFRVLLPSALEGRELPGLDIARAEELLRGVLS